MANNTISQLTINNVTYDIMDATARKSIGDYFRVFTFIGSEFNFNKMQGLSENATGTTIDKLITYYKFNLKDETSGTNNWKLLSMLGISYKGRIRTNTTAPYTYNDTDEFSIRSWGVVKDNYHPNRQIMEIAWRKWITKNIWVHSNYRTLWINNKEGIWKEDVPAIERPDIFRTRSSISYEENITTPTAPVVINLSELTDEGGAPTT